MTDRPTDLETEMRGHREVTLRITIKWTKKAFLKKWPDSNVVTLIAFFRKTTDRPIDGG